MFSRCTQTNSRYIVRQLHINLPKLTFSTANPNMDKYVTKTPRKSNKTESTENEEKAVPKSPAKFQQEQKRTITRTTVKNAIETDKEMYLKMPLEEKRRVYKCKNRYKLLDDVPTWQDMYLENREKLQKKLRKKGGSWLPKKPINEDLNKKVSIWRGDITTLEIDAIVNAANNSLLGGGGVDGAIHSAAGSKLVAECSTVNGCDTGDAKITGGYKLPAKYVIHTVGPIGVKPKLLQGAYLTSLKLAKENKLRSVAFPCISTGIYGYDNEKAAPLVLRTIREWLDEDNNAELTDRIIFCLFMQVDVDLYEELMQVYFPVDSNPKHSEPADDNDVPGEENNSTESAKTNSSSVKNSKKLSDTEMKKVSKTSLRNKAKSEVDSEGMVVEENQKTQDAENSSENNKQMTGVEESEKSEIQSAVDEEMTTENSNDNVTSRQSKTQTESNSKMQTESVEENIQMEDDTSDHHVTKNKQSLKLSTTTVTRSKRQKEISHKEDLTPSELGPPPKFKSNAMETM